MMKLLGIALMGLLLCPPLPAYAAPAAEKAPALGQIERLERLFREKEYIVAEVLKCTRHSSFSWYSVFYMDGIESDGLWVKCLPPWEGSWILITPADLERELFTIRRAVDGRKTGFVLIDKLAVSESPEGEHPSDALRRSIVDAQAMHAALINVRERIESERHRAEAEKRLQELRRSLEESDGKSGGNVTP